MVTLRVPGGYIIAIEGVDAVGKNTHSLLLFEWLSKKGVGITRMSFPDYGSAIGREIKSFLSGANSYPIQLQHLLFAANISEKYDENRTRLRASEVIIVNR